MAEAVRLNESEELKALQAELAGWIKSASEQACELDAAQEEVTRLRASEEQTRKCELAAYKDIERLKAKLAAFSMGTDHAEMERLKAENERLRSMDLDPAFASDAEKDVDYWRLKASEHFTAFMSCNAENARMRERLALEPEEEIRPARDSLERNTRLRTARLRTELDRTRTLLTDLVDRVRVLIKAMEDPTAVDSWHVSSTWLREQMAPLREWWLHHTAEGLLQLPAEIDARDVREELQELERLRAANHATVQALVDRARIALGCPQDDETHSAIRDRDAVESATGARPVVGVTRVTETCPQCSGVRPWHKLSCSDQRWRDEAAGKPRERMTSESHPSLAAHRLQLQPRFSIRDRDVIEPDVMCAACGHAHAHHVDIFSQHQGARTWCLAPDCVCFGFALRGGE